MDIADFLSAAWLGFFARLDGVRCWWIGHELFWRANQDRLCNGDIFCATCNKTHWCRSLDPWS